MKSISQCGKTNFKKIYKKYPCRYGKTCEILYKMHKIILIYCFSVLKEIQKKQLDKKPVWEHNWVHPGKLYFDLERMIMMISQSKIKLNATEDVQEFVKAASKCDFDIDVYYNRILIDAKSILGVLSLDLTKVLTVDCHGENQDFNRTLQKFAVA